MLAINGLLRRNQRDICEKITLLFSPHAVCTDCVPTEIHAKNDPCRPFVAANEPTKSEKKRIVPTKDKC